MNLEENVLNPISLAELQRRWTAVRTAMEAMGIDVLVMQNSNEFQGGYVKYFTDIPARHGVYDTVIFPIDEEMTLVKHGPEGGKLTPATADAVNRGVKQVLTAPTFASVDNTKTLAAELAVESLKTRKDNTIGLVATSSMPYPFLNYLKKNLPTTTFVDATDMVDQIKAIKSPEEIERIKNTAAMQDAVWSEVLTFIEPGKTNFEITAYAQYVGHTLGSEQGLFLAGSAPVGNPVRMGPPHLQGRTLREGDQLMVLIENNGSGGFYTEIGRTCILGKAPQELLEAFEFALEAQRYTLDLLKPGVKSDSIASAHNDFMERHGRPREKRLYAHGQGYDLVERPIIRENEEMLIAADMNIVVHPGYATDSVAVSICDNYMITETGVSECLHKTPKKIFEI